MFHRVAAARLRRLEADVLLADGVDIVVGHCAAEYSRRWTGGSECGTLVAMKIRVELQAYLADYSPADSGTFAYEVPDGATVEDVVRKLGIPEELASVITIGERPRTPRRR